MGESMSRADVQAICLLLDECGEMWADANAWQLHAARGLERLVGGFTGLFMLSSCVDGISRVLEHATTGNAAVPFAEFLKGGAEMAVPGATAGFTELKTTGSFCARFAELGGADYHHSEFYQRFMKPQAAHDTLCALATVSGDTHINFSLSRAADDNAFTQRDADVLSSFAAAVAARCGKRLTTRQQRGEHGLAPREKQTLRALLDGDSEKQIACRLGISLPTAHQYVTNLHRHFEVNSRGELMAYFLRRSPVCADRSATSQRRRQSQVRGR